jgi:hypothetical protein
MVAILGTFFLVSSLSWPEYKKLRLLGAQLNREHAELSSAKERLARLRTLPEIAFDISSRDDSFLAIRYLAQKKKYDVTDISDGTDDISNYITMNMTISHYGSIADVIHFLDKLRQYMPVAYTKYTLTNSGIAVTVRCYYLNSEARH